MGGNLETNAGSHFMSIQTLLCPVYVDVCVNVAKASWVHSDEPDGTNSRPLNGLFPVVKTVPLPAVISVFSLRHC